MILLTHPMGNAFARALLHELEKANMLGLFQTAIAVNDDDLLLKALPPAVRKQLLRRQYPVSDHLIRRRTLREWTRMLAPKMGMGKIARHEEGWASVDGVFQDMDRYVAENLAKDQKKHNITGVYSYEDGALDTFLAAEKLGIKRYYDLPIGYWRAAREIQQEENEINPAWASTIRATRDTMPKLERKDAELENADVIFVASTFTKNTLDQKPGLKAPIVVIPYGAPPIATTPRIPKKDGPLRALFVGSLGQRKGISYLLDAIELMGDKVELTIIGQPIARPKPLEDALNKHRHIATLPHSEVLSEMRKHDVFIFPSLFEGFGLVVLEAMGQGVPVIATPNTAGPDVITDGKDGYIVPIRDPQAIAEKLEIMVNNRDFLTEMSENARQKAATFTWPAYGQRIANQIKQFQDA